MVVAMVTERIRMKFYMNKKTNTYEVGPISLCYSLQILTFKDISYTSHSLHLLLENTILVFC